MAATAPPRGGAEGAIADRWRRRGRLELCGERSGGGGVEKAIVAGRAGECTVVARAAELSVGMLCVEPLLGLFYLVGTRARPGWPRAAHTAGEGGVPCE